MEILGAVGTAVFLLVVAVGFIRWFMGKGKSETPKETTSQTVSGTGSTPVYVNAPDIIIGNIPV